MTKITHHHLIAEQINDNSGPGIMLTQEDGGNGPETIVVHPWQLRGVCEQFGLLANEQGSAKAIASLERRLSALRDRCETLHEFLCNSSAHKHADLTLEVSFATATVDIANEFCADIDQAVGAIHV
jgi:hypothetical protein